MHADALLYLGVAALQQGNPDRAVKLIDRAIRIDSDSQNFHRSHSTATPSELISAPAINQGLRVDSLNSNRADAHYNLGLALNLQGRTEDATSSFLKALALSPRDSSALYNLGCMYRSRANTKKQLTFSEGPWK